MEELSRWTARPMAARLQPASSNCRIRPGTAASRGMCHRPLCLVAPVEQAIPSMGRREWPGKSAPFRMEVGRVARAEGRILCDWEDARPHRLDLGFALIDAGEISGVDDACLWAA